METSRNLGRLEPIQLHLSAPDLTLTPENLRLSTEDLRVLSSKMGDTKTRSPSRLHTLHPLADTFNRGKEKKILINKQKRSLRDKFRSFCIDPKKSYRTECVII